MFKFAKITMVVLAVAGAFALAGCSDDDGGGGKGIDGTLKSYNSAGEQVAEAECECYADALGHSTQEACVAARFEPVTLTQCQKQAASCDTSSYTKLLSCKKSAIAAFGTCINTCADAENEVDYDSCVTERDTALVACEQHRTETLDEAFAACSSGEVPACFFGTDSGSNPNNSSNNDNNATDDTGTDPADTGTDQDVGTDPEDTGTDPVDTGTDPVDTGTDTEDTGTDPEDTGTDSADTGTDPEDTGNNQNDQRIDTAVSTLDAIELSFANQVCDCYASSYPSRQDCMNDNYTPRSADSCTRTAVSCDLSNFEGLYQCFGTVTADLEACISSCPTVQSELDSCSSTAQSAASNCQSQYLTPELQNALTACENGQTPTCN